MNTLKISLLIFLASLFCTVAKAQSSFDISLPAKGELKVDVYEASIHVIGIAGTEARVRILQAGTNKLANSKLSPNFDIKIEGQQLHVFKKKGTPSGIGLKNLIIEGKMQGKGSNQLRAEYMKANFDSLYAKALNQESQPKVFVKLGSVHLSRGISVFRVDDMGKYLVGKSAELNTSFVNIRHLRRYRNGKDLIGTRGWEEVGLLMKLGKKDEWTLTDLRPMRKKLQAGEIKADKSISYELNNYDFLLIPPNDKRAKTNY